MCMFLVNAHALLPTDLDLASILQLPDLPSGPLVFYVITSVSMLSTLSPALRQLLAGIKHILSNNPDGMLYFHLILITRASPPTALLEGNAGGNRSVGIRPYSTSHLQDVVTSATFREGELVQKFQGARIHPRSSESRVRVVGIRVSGTHIQCVGPTHASPRWFCDIGK